MLWRDLREYLHKLDELGELRKIVGASWEEEIGGITELMNERGGPALLFDEIPDYPKGYRVASNLCDSARRIAIAFGLDHDSSLYEMVEEWNQLTRACRPIAPEEVSSGPVFENALTDSQVDLFKFPTPKWHEQDGGRYIGTGVCVIQKDPDTGFVNSGSYRVVIHDEKTCGIFMEHGRHGDNIRRKHWMRGEKCPVVVSVGQDPILTEISGSTLYRCGDGVSELAIAGYFQKSPYPVVRGDRTGIPIPAFSEIAIEGFIPSSDDIMLPEGPFGEWTGYYAHECRPETIVEVKAIYHRNDPIIYGSPPMRPVLSYTEFSCFDLATKRRAEAAGIQGIKSVFSIRPNFRVVALRQMHAQHVDDVIRVLEPGGDQYSGNHIWVLVDDDIDITNPGEVLWAIASRCIPEHGITVTPGTAVWQLDPRIRPGERSNPDKEKGRKRYSAHNLVINACRPYDWMKQFPPVNMNSPELRKRIREKWKELFV